MFGADLSRTQLIDCHGRVTHTLTVRPDGKVSVLLGTLDVVVDPRTRAVHPPGVSLGAGEYSSHQIIDLACRLAGDVGR